MHSHVLHQHPPETDGAFSARPVVRLLSAIAALICRCCGNIFTGPMADFHPPVGLSRMCGRNAAYFAAPHVPVTWQYSHRLDGRFQDPLASHLWFLVCAGKARPTLLLLNMRRCRGDIPDGQLPPTLLSSLGQLQYCRLWPTHCTAQYNNILNGSIPSATTYLLWRTGHTADGEPYLVMRYLLYDPLI